MINVKKVKTYTPVLPQGVGPTSTKAKDALYEVFHDLEQQNCPGAVEADKFNQIVEAAAKIYGLEDLIDGNYRVFEDYEISIVTMSQNQLDRMPEFNGY